MDDDQSDEQLQDFWTSAQRYADIGDLDVVMGRQWGQALPPPAWSFGDTLELADQLLELVLNGHKTATTGLHQEYVDGDEPLPQKGDLSIITDSAGQPRVLIRDVDVQVIRVGDVTQSQVDAEGEGDDLDAWRETHCAVWQQAGYEVGDDTLVVWERFKVLYTA